MNKLPLQDTRGVTLMEVLLAVSIFSVVIGISAQSLVSFYANLDMQEQRLEAAEASRTLLGAIREKRSEFMLEEEEYDWQGFLDWIADQNTEGWTAYLKSHGDIVQLPNHELRVDCFDMDGSEATAASNPIRVHVTSTWTDMKNRTLQAQVATVLASQ